MNLKRKTGACALPWEDTGTSGDAGIWRGSKIGREGAAVSVLLPVTSKGSSVPALQLVGVGGMAPGKDFHLEMQIRAPLWRCLKRVNNLGKYLEATGRKEKWGGRREIECLWLKEHFCCCHG